MGIFRLQSIQIDFWGPLPGVTKETAGMFAGGSFFDAHIVTASLQFVYTLWFHN